MIDPLLETSPHFNMDEYARQMTNELDSYAAWLHKRDVATCVRLLPMSPSSNTTAGGDSASLLMSQRSASMLPPYVPPVLNIGATGGVFNILSGSSDIGPSIGLGMPSNVGPSLETFKCDVAKMENRMMD